MEQKDPALNAHVELSVVLPGGSVHSTSVDGSKPMMDLLVFLCGKYRLNPSSHTLDLVGNEKNPIRFKPNTLIGTLEVEKVILKEKNVEEKKKPTSVVPEQTVRVVVNYKKTQKTIVRVSPLVPLQELIPVISNKCEFDPGSTILVKDFEHLEPFDLTKSLNELGLREVCAVDTSAGLSQHDIPGESLQQDQAHVSGNLNLDKENKGFLNIFRLSKKKREKPTSAPATPLISPQRPLGMSSSSAYCPTYEFNTLPSGVPKKRQAPAPPPPPHCPQSPQKEASQQAPARPVSCVFSDVAPNEAAQCGAGAGRPRAGSLPHGDSASSMKKKRKAPLPPGKAADVQSAPDQAKDSDLGSCPTPDTEDKAFAAKMSSNDQAGIGSEGNLEEIVELEESRAPDVGAEDSRVQKEETPSPHRTKDQPSKRARISASDHVNLADVSAATNIDTEIKLDNRGGGAEQNSSQIAMEHEEKDLSLGNSAVDEQPIAENVSEEVNRRVSVEPSGLIPSGNGGAGDAATSLLLKDSTERFEGFQSTKVVFQDQQVRSERTEVNEEKVAEVRSEEVNKTLDFQPAPGTKTVNDSVSPLHGQSVTNVAENTGDSGSNNFRVPLSSQPHSSVSATSTEPTAHNLSDMEHLYVADQRVTEPSALPRSEAQLTDDTVVTPESPTKTPMIYRSESEPKPKPSNEITRDYIPKIGMTTYKIVPPKSLEKSSFGPMPEVERADQQTPAHDNVPESDTTKQSSNHPGLLASLAQEVTDIRQEAQSTVPIDSATPFPGTESTVSKSVVENESEPLRETVTKRSQSTSEKKMRPGSVFLQLHKRTSGQYVTSALARSSSLPSQSSLDGANEENGMSFQDVSLTKTIDGEIIIPPPPEFAGAPAEKVQRELSKAGGTSASRPSQPPKVAKKPSMRLNPKTLQTTAASKTYTPTSPSPFALAVSSAVRKTQANATCSFKPKHLETKSSSQSSPSDFGNKEVHQASPVPQESNNNNNNSVPKQVSIAEKAIKGDCHRTVPATCPQPFRPQVPSPSGIPKPPLPSPISNPGEIHQAVLDAILSGDGAARLRKAQTFTTI
ncbi:cordon-bleu protein-like 1b isoform X2 [Rhinoraja longicauda]